MSRRRSERRGWRIAGISLLILSAIRIPLPQADYHNVRHHDGPGEVCVYHDHLLRWHPAADHAADVAILHWHWIAPVVDPGSLPPGASDRAHPPGSGLSLHAHLGDWPAPDWTGTPVLQSEARCRLADLLALGHAGLNPLYASGRTAANDLAPPFRSLLRTRDDARARVETLDGISRWNC